MGQGISEVLTFAIGAAISPVGTHNAAVMTVLSPVFGVDLTAKCLGPLST